MTYDFVFVVLRLHAESKCQQNYYSFDFKLSFTPYQYFTDSHKINVGIFREISIYGSNVQTMRVDQILPSLIESLDLFVLFIFVFFYFYFLVSVLCIQFWILKRLQLFDCENFLERFTKEEILFTFLSIKYLHSSLN